MYLNIIATTVYFGINLIVAFMFNSEHCTLCSLLVVYDREVSMLVMPTGCGFKVREQRNEHQAVQLLATSVLVAQLHGCFHMVSTVCR